MTVDEDRREELERLAELARLAALDADDQWVAVYLRISDDPHDLRYGVDRQQKIAAELAGNRMPWCKEPGRLRFYVDNNVTAVQDGGKRRRRSKKNSEYARLLADIARGCVPAVVMYDLDRTMRDMEELEEYITLSQKTGLATMSVQSGDFRLDTTSGRENARIRASIAIGEVERAKGRIADEIAESRDRGIASLSWRPLFGYALAESSVLRKDGKPRMKYRPVPAEADAIREAARRVLDEGKGWNEAARYWNSLGFTGRSGMAWTFVTARQVLTNWKLAGILPDTPSDKKVRLRNAQMENPGGVLRRADREAALREPLVRRHGDWEPILTEDQVERLRARMANRCTCVLPTGAELRSSEIHAACGRPRFPEPRGPKPKNLLTGLLECGVCGSRSFRVNVVRRAGDGTAARKYQCEGHKREQPKLAPGVKGGHLGRMMGPVDDYVTKWIIARLERGDYGRALADRGEDVDQLRAEIAALEDIHGTWVARMVDPKYPNPVTAEKAAAQAERELASKRAMLAAEDGGNPLGVLAGVSDVQAFWGSLEIEEKRRIAGHLIEKIVLQPIGRGATRSARDEVPPEIHPRIKGETGAPAVEGRGRA